MPRRVGTGVALVLALALGALLLWPSGEQVRRLLLDVYLVGLDHGVPRSVGPEAYASALNVLAFAPLGWLGVAALHRRPLLVAGALGVASALIETVQLLPVLHRVPSVLDVLCNTGGGLLGALAASLLLQDPGRQEVPDEGRDVVGDDVG